jgi:hypothetical protein
MRARVTHAGVTIPKRLLEDADEVDIRREGDRVIVAVLRRAAPGGERGRPVEVPDPSGELGESPAQGGPEDASEHHDRYLYGV